VNGENAHPIFKFLKAQTPVNMGGNADIDWNFAKFMVSSNWYFNKIYRWTVAAGTLRIIAIIRHFSWISPVLNSTPLLLLAADGLQPESIVLTSFTESASRLLKSEGYLIDF